MPLLLIAALVVFVHRSERPQAARVRIAPEALQAENGETEPTDAEAHAEQVSVSDHVRETRRSSK